ncbi:unnamed protein product, partial [Symbiodinium sp. CCMP2592]
DDAADATTALGLVATVRRIADFLTQTCALEKTLFQEELQGLKCGWTMWQLLRELENSGATPEARLQRDAKGARLDNVISATRQLRVSVSKIEQVHKEIDELSEEQRNFFFKDMWMNSSSYLSSLEGLLNDELFHGMVIARGRLMCAEMKTKLAAICEMTMNLHTEVKSWKKNLDETSSLEDISQEAVKSGINSLDADTIDTQVLVVEKAPMEAEHLQNFISKVGALADLKPLEKDLQAARAECKAIKVLLCEGLFVVAIGTPGNALRDAVTSSLEEIAAKKIPESDVQPALLAKARDLKEAQAASNA